MVWQINHNFIGLPCERGGTLYWGPAGLLPKARPKPCAQSAGLGMTKAVRNGATRTLANHGIGYQPVGDDGSWLWCLGGPSLYRLPLPPDYEDCADDDTCLDLNVWVCEEHQVITADLFPYDLVPETGGSSINDPRRSTPIPLGSDTHAATAFLHRLDAWLTEILVLPAV